MSNEQSNQTPTLEGYDMTNVVPFDPDYRTKNSTTPTEEEALVSEEDPIQFARLVSAQTGVPYAVILKDLYNAVVSELDVIDDPTVFIELLLDADKLKEELIREGVL